MFFKISKNVFSSFLKFVLITALIHIVILIIKTFKDGNIKNLNYFGILDLNTFYPKIMKGTLSDVISLILMTAIFSSFLVWGFVSQKCFGSEKEKADNNKCN